MVFRLTVYHAALIAALGIVFGTISCQARADSAEPSHRSARQQQRGETGENQGAAPGKRQKRILRWRLVFATKDGEDYAKQLEALGAILAVPEEKRCYRVLRDLKQRPARGKIEDPAKMKRIFWIDDKPQSVAGLAKALQLPSVPKFFICFFPVKLEKELVEKELKYQNRKEEEIAETHFKVIRRKGKYTVEVTQQKLKDP